MDILTEFSLWDNIDDINFKSLEYQEFCEAIDDIHNIIRNDSITEAVIDDKSKIHKSNVNAINNTKKTIKDTAEIYNDITDAGGNLISAQYNLMIKLIKGTTKIISWTCNIISRLINGLATIISMPDKIGTKITNRIKGSIELYITADDIKNIYDTHLILKLKNLIVLSEEFSKGEAWGGFVDSHKLWHKIVDKDKAGMDKINGIQPSQNDLKISKQMHSNYDRIASISFSKSSISLNDANNRKIYFSDEKIVTFTDLSGNVHNENYLGSLKILLTDLNSMKDNLKNLLNLDITKKFNTAQSNSTFACLNNASQTYIVDTIKMVAGAVDIIGNIIKYTSNDIKSINGAYKEVMALNKKAEKEAEKHKDIK